jgi:ribosomal protein S21
MKKKYTVKVELKPGESQEKLLKRFTKKCKKENITKEYIEKTSFFTKKSLKKRQKRLKNAFLKKKN